jgi:hypothetical protein
MAAIALVRFTGSMVHNTVTDMATLWTGKTIRPFCICKFRLAFLLGAILFKKIAQL